jgi:hypothetical protein
LAMLVERKNTREIQMSGILTCTAHHDAAELGATPLSRSRSAGGLGRPNNM